MLTVTKTIEIEIFGVFNLTVNSIWLYLLFRGFRILKLKNHQRLVITAIVIAVGVIFLLILLIGIIKYYKVLKTRRQQAR